MSEPIAPTASSSTPELRPPRLTKRAISLFFRVGCERQLLLHLYTDKKTRAALNMPPHQGGRAGLGLVGRHGFLWQAKKVKELQGVFGASNVILESGIDSAGRIPHTPLDSVLTSLTPYQFLVEGKFSAKTSAFQAAVGLLALDDLNGLTLQLGDLQPDLIQVLPPLIQHQADWTHVEAGYCEEVLPSGHTRPVDPVHDSRVRLRVADIKMASQPGAHYYAEVVFYSMALAGWLVDQDLAKDYLVVAAPAVLPGSLEDSELLKQVREWRETGYIPTAAELSQVFENDLEVAPVEAFAPRLRDLFANALPTLLKTPWTDTAYHVDYRCSGCEFLGDPHIRDTNNRPTQDSLHCWPTAERTNHLSRVFGLSKGSVWVLREHQVADVPALARASPDHTAFTDHQGLRAKRTVYPSRADALGRRTSTIVPDSGGDALMPRWPDLHVYVFVDYDPATAMTVSFGLRAFWKEPLPYGATIENRIRRWGRRSGDTEVFLVDRQGVPNEWREFRNFLRHIRRIFREVHGQDEADDAAGRRNRKTLHSSYQIYLWDDAQRRHLVRLVSRYLPRILADRELRVLAWLFPPPELLTKPDDATRRSPFTLVYDVVRNTVALPNPHHYTLLDVAATFNDTSLTSPTIHPLYRDTLSNLLPPERIHEFWLKRGKWQETQALIVETSQKKLLALGLVVSTLERRLKDELSLLSAPLIPTPPKRTAGLAPVSHLWLEFTHLNGALASLEADRVRAMPPHEREARFKSARLLMRLEGAGHRDALPYLQRVAPGPLTRPSELLVYKLAPGSYEFNARPGDFGYAIVPDAHTNFLDQHPYVLTKDTSIRAYGTTVADAKLTAVTIESIERQQGLVALRPDPRSRFAELTNEVGISFAGPCTLDRVETDYLTKKVQLTLRGIANPPIAQPTRRMLEALGLPAGTTAGRSRLTPAAEVLWDGSRLREQRSGTAVAPLRKNLEKALDGVSKVLMHDQWNALEIALDRRLTLVWGPPGTGKSYTLRAIIVGAVLNAASRRQPLRILVSANTYPAVDNILLRLHDDLSDLHSTGRWPCTLHRIQSDRRPVEHDFDDRYRMVENLPLNRFKPSVEVKALLRSLDAPDHIMVVGSPTQQLHNLAIGARRNPPASTTQREWFDLIVLDEASQVDVAHSTLVFSKRAAGGTCVLAGDDLQLPPIHPATPPLELEDVVGSIYNYCRHHLGVQPVPLNVSFRSNSTLIAFTREAGYEPELRARSPDLRIRLRQTHSAAPEGWPSDLTWTSDHAKIMDPDYPITAIVYKDRRSGQANRFEAESIVSLVWLFRRDLLHGLDGELDPLGVKIRDGRYRAPRTTTPSQFWRQSVGIVVPHRAQMGLIVAQLQSMFPDEPPDLIRGAVDTVERFQGQQRDIILASFGIGDPDVIASEEEFLYNLRRFNVMASRARAKLVVFLTESLIEHLSNDQDVLAESLLVKRFAEQTCASAGTVTLYESGQARTCDLRRAT